ncbi:MAG: GMC family oxidoreductase [Hyphomicrobiales bacterium]|nr:GMC family oxidoreductase [Hyphomicrobiales bacterium]
MAKTAEQFDAVVVGSGPGGAAAAWALAEAGARVLVLEAGPRYDPFADYRLERPDWEARRFPEKVPTRGRQSFAPLQELDPAWRDLRSWNLHRGPMVAGPRRAAWAYHHVVGVGGSTLHFAAEAHRLHPDAMRMRDRFGVAADWPLTYAELEPFYETAERIVGVAGPAISGPGADARPRRRPLPLPAHPLSHASRHLARGFAALGMGWQANTQAALSRDYDGRPACNYCAGCGRGCPRTDKGSADVTFVAKAEDSGRCVLRPGTRVLRLEAGLGDRVAQLLVAGPDGRVARLAARSVVLACGAVETPRLLLLSAGNRAPHGLGNESGQVGRNFMETLFWTSSALHPDNLGSHRGLPSDIISWHHNAPDAVPGTVGGCRFSAGVAEADLVGPMAYAQRVVGGWGRAHHRRMAETFGRVLTVGAIGESLPNDGTYVDLDPRAHDDLGAPKARIHARLDGGDLVRLRFMARTARDVLAAAGCDDPFEEYGAYDAFSATHVFGTCRMGDDPRDSVVDASGRSHRWENLYIADASVFPSSGGGESPSLTIEALAIRTGTILAERLRKGEI